jgi:NADH:ubiquinone oxidoreductase subunit 2 (subunit N)
MYYYLRVVWAMYFTEQEGAVAPTSPASDLTPAPDERPMTEPASADDGAVAVAERIVVATPAATQGQATAKEPVSVLSSIGLAIAVIGVFALGVAPWLVTPIAAEAARVLFAGR